MEATTTTKNTNGLKLGKETGSVTNWLMSAGNSGTPVVGEGATEFSWTDRHAYTVTEVSADGKSCTIQEDIATRTDGNGMSDAQSYAYSPNPDGQIKNLVFKWNAWRYISKHGDENKYPKISIKFGVRQKYYDYSF